MTPLPFAIGQHVWNASGSMWLCRCRQTMRVYTDHGGREHFTAAKPCTYRPTRHMAPERNSDGVVVKLYWLGDW